MIEIDRIVTKYGRGFVDIPPGKTVCVYRFDGQWRDITYTDEFRHWNQIRGQREEVEPDVAAKVVERILKAFIGPEGL